MEFSNTNISGVVLCKPKIFADERGYFYESFHKKGFEQFMGKTVNFCQDNEAKSQKGVLRGLHYQIPPFAQSKLVRVIKGTVLDVAVDIRKSSKTFGKYVMVELSEHNKHQLFIPAGLAHGYVVLSDEAIFCYKVDNYYNKASERGIIYNDETLKIDWQLSSNEFIVSEKDTKLPAFKNATFFNK